MRLFEYQAKELFKEAGIAVPEGIVIDKVSETEAAAEQVGLPCVLKAQVLQGGRGKAGLIQFASTEQQAQDKADALFSKKIGKVLVEQALDIEKEMYLGVTIDPTSACALVMASTEGGIDIEQVAAKEPEKVIKEQIDITRGIMPFQAREILFQLGLRGDGFKQTFKVITVLFNLFRQQKAELVEINPLVITKEDGVIAADGKVILDDSVVSMQKEFTLSRECFDSDIEFEAARKGIPYIQFDGDIGLMCAGAGLTNTVYDLINDFGGSIANYLEFGGPNYKRAVEAMELTLKGSPRVVLIVTFGTIARADVMAEGIAEAIDKLKPKIPIITAIRGTGEEKAQKILEDIGLKPLYDTEEAVKEAVRLSKGGGE